MGEKQLFKLKAESAMLKQYKRQRNRTKLKSNHQPVFKSQQVKDQLVENLSFCGCGFLGIYHVGVATCFHQYAPQFSAHKISGSSAGAIVAVAHICGSLVLADAAINFLKIAIEARSHILGPFHPSFNINELVKQALERGLPDDVHLKVSGKLHISLTRVYDGENVIVSKFNSKEDVIEALLCSCFIPFWTGLVAPKYKGVSYIDGAFSNNLVILDEKTITVSPFAGEADICPQDDMYNLMTISFSNTSLSISPHNLYRLSHALMPPSPQFLSDLCAQGFADGIRFLRGKKIISRSISLEIRSSLIVTEILDETEIIESKIGSKFSYRRRSKQGIVMDIFEEQTTYIEAIPWYPFFYAYASTALVYIMNILKSSARAGGKHQRKIAKLVQYFSL